MVDNSEAYKGNSDITDTRIQALNKSYHEYLTTNNTISENENMKAVAYMLDIDIWDIFVGEKAEYAIGGPTVELLTKSYSKKYGVDYRAKASNTTSYEISKNGGATWANVLGSMFNTSDSQYVIGSTSKAQCMWIASPSAGEGNVVLNVNYNGSINRYYCDWETVGFRPIVCLNSKVKLKPVENGYAKE